MTHIDNETLVAECGAGNREAMDIFYKRFAPRMLRLIGRYVSEVKDAEDILHDGFIVAFTHIDTVKNPERVDYWLATIMRNLSLRFLSSQDVGQVLHDIPEVEACGEIEDIMDMDVLETLIRKLPNGYQKVFRLAVLEKKSHKEIGELLGIAPKTSSSQLFHAKMMMRRLITEYQKQAGMLSFLIIVLSATLLWRSALSPSPSISSSISPSTSCINSPSPSGIDNAPQALAKSQPMASTPQKPAAIKPAFTPQLPIANATPTLDCGKLAEAATTYPCISDSLDGVPGHDSLGQVPEHDSLDRVPEHDAGSDSEAVRDSLARAYEPMFAMNDYVYTPEKERESGFYLGLGMSAGISTIKSVSDSYRNDANSGSSVGDPGGLTDDESNKPEQPQYMRSGGFRDYRSVGHHNDLPVSFAITAGKRLNNILSVESGLTYTYLHSVYDKGISKIDFHWHYIGIPLRLVVNACSIRRVSLYASAGGQVDFPVYCKGVARESRAASNFETGKFHAPVEWSLSAAMGVSFKVTDNFGIFMEPTLRYQFYKDADVPNIWTDNRWVFSIPIGLRFSW